MEALQVPGNIKKLREFDIDGYEFKIKFIYTTIECIAQNYIQNIMRNNLWSNINKSISEIG